MLLKCDTNLNQQFLKLYPSANPEVSYFGAGIVETPDHGFLVVGSHRVVTNTDKSAALIFKIDAQGNQVWWKDLPPVGTVKSMYFYDIIAQPDGSYIAVGNKRYDVQNEPYYDHYWVVGFDGQGNILWEREHEVHYSVVWNKIVPAPDGNYLVCGAEWNEPGPDGGGYPVYGVVGKLSPEGDLLWMRRYISGLPFNTAMQLYAITATSDGGILAGGHTQNGLPERQNFWMLKLDSLGCLTPGCDSTSAVIDIEAGKEPGLVLSPNPTTGRCVIVHREGVLMEGLEVFDTWGRRVLLRTGLQSEQVEVDLSESPSGVYYCVVRLETGKSVVRQVVVVRE